MTQDFSTRLTIFVAFICAVFVLVLWWPTRWLPYHWDAAGFVIPYAQSLYENGFRLVVSQGVYGTHGPLLMYLIALSWKILGHSPLAAHLVILPFAWAYLFVSYLIAKRWLGWPWALALVAWLGLMPVFAAQIGQVYIDIPVAALCLLGVWLVLRRSWLAAGIAFALALLTKESAVIFVVWCWLYLYWQRKTLARRDWLMCLTPVIVYGLYLLINKQLFGYLWFIPNYDRLMPTDWSVAKLFETFVIQCTYMLVAQGRWFILPLFGWGLFELLGRLPSSNRQLQNQYVAVQLGLLIGLGLGFFTFAGQAHSRYYLLLLPFLYMAGLWGLRQATQSATFLPRKFSFGLVGFLLIGFGAWSLSLWHPPHNPNGFYYESMDMDRSYIPMLKSWMAATDFIEAHYPNALVVGSFPEVYQLTEPFQGYVDKPIAFEHCVDFLKNQPSVIIHQPLLVYYHHYIPLQGSCEQIIKQYNGELLRRFENDGWWVEVYEVNF